LQRMFQDISINKDTNAQFKEKMQQTHDAADLTGESKSSFLSLISSRRLSNLRFSFGLCSRFQYPSPRYFFLASISSHDQPQHARRTRQNERTIRSLLHEQTLWKETHLDLATLS
jgi:hypothetical protein